MSSSRSEPRTGPQVIARRRAARRPRGFSLIETLVALFVVSLLLAGVVALFNLSGRIARVQTNLSDMQQSLRIAQYDMIRSIRMAGRGGLPRGDLPLGWAVSIRNDIPATGNMARVAIANGSSPEAVEGSDILTVRGVFSSPIYQINPAAGTLVLQGSPPTAGSVTITDPGPSGIPQDLTPLRNAVTQGLGEALLLRSPLGSEIYAVVELNPTGPNTNLGANAVTIDFNITGGTHTIEYGAMSAGGAYPPTLQAISSLGILEEHSYYIRKEFAVPGDAMTDPRPRLSRARVFPNTSTGWAGQNSNLRLDIADNILDLQVAFGVDIDGDGQIVEADPVSSTDDWVFNTADDDETNPALVTSWNTLPSGQATRLFYLRLTTVARTGRRDVGYVSPPMGLVEDHDYGEADTPADNEARGQRMYRRQLMQTIVDLRNIS